MRENIPCRSPKPTDVKPLPNYDRVAAAFGMPASTLRSHVTRLRGRYRAALHAEVRQTVDSEAEVMEELSALRRALIEN